MSIIVFYPTNQELKYDYIYNILSKLINQIQTTKYLITLLF